MRGSNKSILFRINKIAVKRQLIHFLVLMAIVAYTGDRVRSQTATPQKSSESSSAVDAKPKDSPEKTTSASSEDAAGVEVAGLPDDPTFDRYVSLDELAEAWAARDPAR